MVSAVNTPGSGGGQSRPKRCAENTYRWAVERIPLAPTVGSDLGKPSGGSCIQSPLPCSRTGPADLGRHPRSSPGLCRRGSPCPVQVLAAAQPAGIRLKAARPHLQRARWLAGSDAGIEHMFVQESAKRRCSFPGCGRPHLAKGLCRGHYEQQRCRRSLQPLPFRVRGDPACSFAGCGNVAVNSASVCQAAAGWCRWWSARMRR